MSQSPSLRGSGRFTDAAHRVDEKTLSQSPSLRGSGRFGRTGRASTSGRRRVSNPFIAGQWSLLVVAAALAVWRAHVSIPFIAGQWSLPGKIDGLSVSGGESQSPSLRGSGRFWTWTGERWAMRRVSIPFIAGQWSLQGGAMTNTNGRRTSQSPSLRGSGRFAAPARRNAPVPIGSQSPSLRGSGRFDRPPPHGGGAGRMCLNPLHCGAVVASTTAVWRAWRAEAGLNPLHCGAVVASIRSKTSHRVTRCVSIPFIAGQWSLRQIMSNLRPQYGKSQSPSLRGSGRFLVVVDEGRFARARLNPLHCGAVVASRRRERP